MTVGTPVARLAMPIDAIGRVSNRTVTAAGHAFATAYGYAAGNNGSGNTTTLISSLTQSGENFTYTYDDVGNIASVVQNNKTTAYTYDALGQLIRVDDENDTTSGTAGTTWTYEYDRGGNILAKKRYAYTTGTLGTALETVTYTYDTTWKDKLINYNGITIEYDAIGNPTKAGTKTGEVWDPDTWHYTWARGRQLQVMYKGSFGQPGYDEIAFTYNPEGLRTRKTRMYYSNGDVAYSSTEYTLHGKNIVHMTQGSDSLHFFYDASNRPAIVEWNNGVTAAKYAYIQNLQGDIVGIVDSNGTEVVKYTYDAWGRVLSATGSLASTLGTVQPFRYRGYVYDVETGLYYLKSRYYNSTWVRFLCADSINTNNLFSYCINNPIVLQDNDGKSFVSSIDIFYKKLYNYFVSKDCNYNVNTSEFVGMAKSLIGKPYSEMQCSALIDTSAGQKKNSEGMSTNFREKSVIYGLISDIGFENLPVGTVLGQMKKYSGKKFDGKQFDAKKIIAQDVVHGGILLGTYRDENNDLHVKVLQSTSSPNYKKVCITDFTESTMEWLGWNVWMWDKRVIPDCLEWIVIDDIDEGE